MNEAQILDGCLQNDVTAIKQFRDHHEARLIARLIKRGATSSEATDVVADVLSDCISMKNATTSLLEKYHGRVSLAAWLSTVVTNRFIDYKRRERFQVSAETDAGSHLLKTQNQGENVESMNSDLSQLMRHALSKALSQCPKDAQLMLSLVYIDGISQRKIATMWNWQESKVSRYLQETMVTISKATLQEVKRVDPWLTLTWEDFGEVCQTLVREFF